MENLSGWYKGKESIAIETPSVVEKGAEGFKEKYVFEEWRGTHPETSSKVEIEVDKSVNISAFYEYQSYFYLRVDSPYGNPKGEGWYPAESEAKFSIEERLPAGISDHVFTKWIGDSSATTNSASIIMDSPKSVTAKFTSDYTKILIPIMVIITFAVIAGIVAYILKTKARAKIFVPFVYCSI